MYKIFITGKVLICTSNFSAGVGRTGTFIAVDHLLQHIRDHEEIDIYTLVLEMRNNRCNMVQTEVWNRNKKRRERGRGRV